MIKTICIYLVTWVLIFPASVFAAETKAIGNTRWQSVVPVVTDSVQFVWGGKIPTSRLDEINSLEISDLEAYQIALQTALDEVSFEELRLGQGAEPSDLAVRATKLETLLAGTAAGTAIGSDLRFNGFIKALRNADRKFTKSQYVGMTQLFLIKEWMIIHSVIHANTIQNAIKNPNDRENATLLNLASRKLSDFLDTTSKLVKENTISRTQSLFDSLSPEVAQELQIALGIDYRQLQEIEANLSSVKSYTSNPSLDDLANAFGEKPAKQITKKRFSKSIETPLAIAAEIVIPITLVSLVLSIVPGLGAKMLPFVLYGTGGIAALAAIIAVAQYSEEVSSDRRGTKIQRALQEQRLATQYHENRKKILTQFLYMGQSPYTCSDVLGSVLD